MLLKFMISISCLCLFQIFVYFQYPRQLLTNHFWSQEQAQLFFQEDHEEKKRCALDLKQYLDPNKSVNGHLPLLKDTSDRHIRLLAGSLKVVRIGFALDHLPAFYFRNRVTEYAQHISHDDSLLESESVDTLTLEELQQCCAERGLDPGSSDTTILLQQLKTWLSTKQSKLDALSPRSISLASMAPEHKPSILAHLIAFQATELK